MIYPNPNMPQGETIENNNMPSMEDMFIEQVCNSVISALNVRYGEIRITRALLFSCIKDRINNRANDHREGLLQQYARYILDQATDRMGRDLELESEVNHDYALHAKLSDILKEIRTKFKRVNDWGAN